MDSFLEWLQILLPTVLVVGSGLYGYVLKSRTEEMRVAREKLRENQKEIYQQILEPYINILANQTEGGKADGKREFDVVKLRRTAFELSLIGSDNVIRAYNKIMRYFYSTETKGQDVKQIFTLFATLMLEVRKSLGINKTKLKSKEMLESMIKDIEKIE